jgi:hypothetical protein
MRAWWSVLGLIAGACGGNGDGGTIDGGGGGGGDGNGGDLPEIVASDMGGVTAVEIALAPDGSPRIVFVRSVARELHYAEPNGGAWHVERVLTETDGGSRLGIAVDSTGVVHVLHEAGQSELHYLQRRNGTWTSVPLAGRFPLDLAIGPADSVHIAFRAAGTEDVHYGRWNGTSFETEAVTTNLLLHLAIAVAPDGTVHLITNNHTFGTPGAFTSESTMVEGLMQPSVAVDSAGQVHVMAVSQAATTQLVQLRREGGTWTSTPVAAITAAPNVETSIAVDATDAVHAAGSSSAGFHYYEPAGTDVTISAAVTYGSLGDLAVAADGTAHAVFPSLGTTTELHYVRP